ncbi:TIGR01440 family protein [Desulfuribacillus stibiiarsenatis]|uniref:UPF0340 protein BHU72_04915 n=2 Tax=Desulfuribacillus stibiiarsenatis TaxID=1390249 RepID=A0A1E5L639_9FIRM|nr:TIGR01440 family protein [Desulfuribacillus stibiiarsenatis]
MNLVHMKSQVTKAIEWLLQAKTLSNEHILIIGTSTSEVAGAKIGTAGSISIAETIFDVLEQKVKQHSFHLAFQCCEHLNRALVVERSTLKRFQLEEVSARPVAKAGGSMATTAYLRFENPALVETIRADAGIDIGETMIGMHLKQVAVPVRYPDAFIGQARVLLAFTRPKLIGGCRAEY